MRARLSSLLLAFAAASWAFGCADPDEPDGGGSNDAGSVLDAAANDAGTSDVGTPDAGTPDAGTPDTGMTLDADVDGGELDSGALDAGTPDVGTPDAGPPPFSTRFQLVATDDSSCALFPDGRVKCWGSVRTQPAGSFGRTPNTMGPNLPYLDLGAGLRVARLGANNNAVCGLLEGGGLRCFGDNTYGQLGFRGPGVLASPTMPPTVQLGSQTATAVSMGWTHTCALLDDRSVWCWGANSVGELGQGTVASSSTALHVDLGTGRTAKAIDADGYFGCAILDNDRLKCWGANGNGAGDVSGIGGQLGTGDTRARGNNANEMGDQLLPIDLGIDPNTAQPWRVRQVRTGITRTCALLENDRLKCFGRNDGAPDVLGTGNNISYGGAANTLGDLMPFIDLGINPATSQPWRVRTLDVGDSMSCALLENERLKCWGAGSLGSIGTGNNLHIGDSASEMGDALPFLDLGTNPATAQPWRVLQIGCGKYHSCAVLEGNRVKCWGYNSAGQLGLGDNMNRGDMPGQMGDALPLVELQ